MIIAILQGRRNSQQENEIDESLSLPVFANCEFSDFAS
jgi:hypothetical protein